MITTVKEKAVFLREVQIILTLYLGTLLGGFSSGFSSIALPGIKQEWDLQANASLSSSFEVQVSDPSTSWLGEDSFDKIG